jgi:sugar/nucleoside kinase (ribokinase family)
MKYDMVSLGPARMDVFVGLPEDEVLETCSIDRQRCMIELGFGEKIPIKSINFEIGGNTGNNAVGLSRLGFKVAMVGTMGDHFIENEVLHKLESEGIDTKYITKIPGKFGFGVIINYQGERTILSYYPDNECLFKIDPDIQTDWVYLTTAGQDYECFYEDAVKWVKQIGAKIAFNPGSRQIKDGVAKIKYAYEASEIIFINREEAMGLLEIKNQNVDIKDLLSGVRNLGPKIVVITNGPDGTYSFDGQKYLHMPVVEAPVVERTGAGDAFGSGFLGALLQSLSLEDCLKWGTVNSASVLGYIGPQAGLLNRQQITDWLAKSSAQVEALT